MPVDSTHLDYANHIKTWRKIRACIEGQDAVKLAGEEYLPKPSGMSDDQYRAYKERASFFGATSRTVQGLHGAMFRKSPSVTMPAGQQFERLISNVDLAGTPFDIIASNVAEEIIKIGRVGVLTDMNARGEPYLVVYHAENIINWREQSFGNVTQPDQFILREYFSVPAADGFGSEPRKRYRVLELDENGLYQVRVFSEPDEGAGLLVDVIQPTVRGKRINYIPFNVISPTQLELAVRKSPIKELVDVNITNYQTKADLQHGAHWTALPTPWLAADNLDDKKELYIGSLAAWKLPQGSNVGMLTLKADDLGALFKLDQEQKNEMAQLGARLLEDQKKAAETAESKKIQYSGENSILATIANTTSRALTLNLRWAVEWMGGNPADVSVQLNTDFFDASMDPTQITALLSAVQGGYISHDTFLFNLQRGEVLPPGRTIEEEKDLISEEMPTLGGTQPALIDGTATEVIA